MTFCYSPRATFDKYTNGAYEWDKYIEWSRLFHITELVSLDGILNNVLIEPDRDSSEVWNYIVTDELYETGFFTSMEYVLQNVEAGSKFNLLAVVIEPVHDCKEIAFQDFEFIGYDLLDKSYGISALTNCGGFDESFLPSDLNRFGIVQHYDQAFDIKKKLLKNNREEYHANTNVIAVWRHKTIGRSQPGQEQNQS